jgi:hypothetical protein
MRLLRSFALTAALLGVAQASSAQYNYAFSAAPAGFTPFSFSFDVPALLQAGDPFSFAPFSVSDGTSSWLITQGASTALDTQGRCFLFSTAGVGLPNGANTQCSLGTPAGGANFWVFDGGTSLPTTTGTTGGWYVQVFADGSLASGGQDFDGHLTISAVPENHPTALLLAGLLVLGGVAYRRQRG